jgi:hypothetical protein
MRSFFLILFIVFIGLQSFSQPSFTFNAIKDDSLVLDGLKKDILGRYKKDSTAVQGDNKKYITGFYRRRVDFLTDMFKENEMVGHVGINSYLSLVAANIVNANPELKTLGTRFLFSRAYWPNAFSAGEGTIVFNIGLFSRLNNESEMAFVLCHELAHLYLDHSNKTIAQYVNTIYSDEFQEKLKELSKKEFERNKELNQLEKKVVFTTRRHGREHESEADSIALRFIKNTRYDATAALTCLALLDEIDKDTYDTEQGLPALFNFADYPFKERWIKKEEAFFGSNNLKNLTTKEEDSLKTHPDCKLRIKQLTPVVSNIDAKNRSAFVVSAGQFDSLKKVFAFEILEYCYNSDNVSRCLYQAMALQQQYPGNLYITTMIGRCFNAMYTHQKKHTLNTIVSLPSPYQEKNYNTLLEFIQNLSLQDIAAISYSHLKKHEALFGTDKAFTTAFNTSRTNLNSR